jgi:hypothetical protein
MGSNQDNMMQEGLAVATLGSDDRGHLVECDLIIRASADPGDQLLRDVGAASARRERQHMPSVGRQLDTRHDGQRSVRSRRYHRRAMVCGVVVRDRGYIEPSIESALNPRVSVELCRALLVGSSVKVKITESPHLFPPS